MVKKNLYRATEIFICEYCGRYTPRLHHNQKKYCHKSISECAKNAEKEHVNARVKKYYRRNVDTERLGQSSIGVHANTDFTKEQKIIERERRRLGL